MAKAPINKSLEVLQLLEVTNRDISVGSLNVHFHTEEDPTGYQRFVEKDWVRRKVAEGIVRVLFGRILVARRTDGTYWIVDGQQRWELAKAAGWEKVPCYVFESDGPETEAIIFSLQDDRSKLDVHELFQSRLAGKDAEAMKILKICQDRKFQLVYQKGSWGALRWPVLNCLQAVQNIYHKNRNLEQVLDFIEDNWCQQTDAMRNNVLLGLSHFMKCYQYDKKQLARKLKAASALTVAKNADKLLFEFGSGGQSKIMATVQAIVDIYNSRQKEKLIPFAQLRREMRANGEPHSII